MRDRIIELLVALVMESLSISTEHAETHPCHALIERGLRDGIGSFADEIILSKKGEFALNGSGLKLVWNALYSSSPLLRGKVIDMRFQILGHQLALYPNTVLVFREVIQKAGFAE